MNAWGAASGADRSVPMLARALLLVTAAILLAGCVDSQRLRSNLGGPPAPTESRQDSKK